MGEIIEKILLAVTNLFSRRDIDKRLQYEQSIFQQGETFAHYRKVQEELLRKVRESESSRSTSLPPGASFQEKTVCTQDRQAIVSDVLLSYVTLVWLKTELLTKEIERLKKE